MISTIMMIIIIICRIHTHRVCLASYVLRVGRQGPTPERIIIIIITTTTTTIITITTITTIIAITTIITITILKTI